MITQFSTCLVKSLGTASLLPFNVILIARTLAPPAALMLLLLQFVSMLPSFLLMKYANWSRTLCTYQLFFSMLQLLHEVWTAMPKGVFISIGITKKHGVQQYNMIKVAS